MTDAPFYHNKLASPHPEYEQNLIDQANAARFRGQMSRGVSVAGGGMSLAGLLSMNPGLLTPGVIAMLLGEAGVSQAAKDQARPESELEAYATSDRRY